MDACIARSTTLHNAIFHKYVSICIQLHNVCVGDGSQYYRENCNFEIK